MLFVWNLQIRFTQWARKLSMSWVLCDGYKIWQMVVPKIVSVQKSRFVEMSGQTRVREARGITENGNSNVTNRSCSILFAAKNVANSYEKICMYV